MRKTSSNTVGGRELQKVWQKAIYKNLGYHYFDTNDEFAVILIKEKLLISIHQNTKDVKHILACSMLMFIPFFREKI